MPHDKRHTELDLYITLVLTFLRMCVCVLFIFVFKRMNLQIERMAHSVTLRKHY